MIVRERSQLYVEIALLFYPDLVQLKDVSEKQEPYCRKAEMIIKHELSEGRNRMAVVRSGSNFFDVIKSEQKAKVTVLLR